MAIDNQSDTLEVEKKSVEPTNLAGLSTSPSNAPGYLSESQFRKAPQSLDAWVDYIFAKDAQQKNTNSGELSNEDYRPTINLGRFGLKTPEDVKKFLHSPAGEAVIGEIGAEIALEKAIEEERQFEQQQQRLLMSKIQALLFLWFLDEKANASDKIKEIVMQQNEKAIERAKTPVPETKSTAIDKSIKSVDSTLANYSTALKNIEAKEQALDKKMEQLETEKVLMEEKYNIFEYNMNMFEQSLDENDSLSPEEIQQKLEVLDAQIIEKYAEIQKLIEMDKDDEAEALRPVIQGLHTQVAGFNDMLAVDRNEKYYVDANGDTVSSPKDAVLTLDANQKLVKDENGQVHLIKSTDDWEKIKEDPEAKAAARKGYEAIKQNPDAMSIQSVIHHNKKLEKEFHSTRVEDVKAQKDECQAQKTIINNEISQLTAIRGNLLNQANQANQSTVSMEQLPSSPVPTPVPTPKSGGNVATPKSSQASPIDLFKNRMEELQQAKQLTRDDLLNLASLAPPNNRTAANAYLQMMFVNMPRTGNIPFQTMQSMLKNMERFGVDATKGITNIQNPTELVAQDNDKKNELEQSSSKESTPEEVKEEEYSSPTPLSTSPK
ncbi:hypothetical protein [Legionella bononiensis]|uniref:LidA long coiled-coil domain-containing protein n=1 Tax=Legionella bononiensis TaxID=2793102 RepID=A0ABS1W8I1_9GAMM|nr:hypothetical protein [Legionella bononiensis]MBL7479815.1 hypothetical protein [Legionella bononiensis]MBL7525670.1 hypothetical protein [Legionella bononiensis]MBL7561853.1 hypothetical protein [Legionella bononiensis]